MSIISLKVEFGGGLELLFSNQRSHKISLPSLVAKSAVIPSESSSLPQTPEETETKAVDLTYLIFWLRDNLLQERAELFIESGTVRPGILVLVNDTDWELEGEGDYELKDGDEIVFISTLHGG